MYAICLQVLQVKPFHINIQRLSYKPIKEVLDNNNTIHSSCQCKPSDLQPE